MTGYEKSPDYGDPKFGWRHVIAMTLIWLAVTVAWIWSEAL